MTPLVSIIIPVFNQLDYTRTCLAALHGDSHIIQCAEIVVVDNGSSDDTAAFLSAESTRQERLVTVRLEENSGFARACNIGAERARGPILAFLNNDTLPQSGWLQALLQTLALRNVGLVGPKLLYPEDRRINSAGYVYNRSIGSFYPLYEHYPEDFPGANRRREFQALLGACMLLSRRTFEAAGAFSEIGLEDIDLCLKIRKSGLKVVYEPRATVLHHGSITLKHSPKESIPPSDAREFTRRWPAEDLISDDMRYYSEDGLTISDQRDEGIHLADTSASSMAIYRDARMLASQGQQIPAEEKLKCAIALYLGNKPAYCELIASLIERNELQIALYWAEKMVCHLSDIHQARLILFKLYCANGRHADAAREREYLLEDWATPAGIREEVLSWQP